MWDPKPTHDTPAAEFARLRSPGFSCCMRCGFPWNKVKSHTTWYKIRDVEREVAGKGCFPLCEGCWELLGAPEARIEYYQMLLDEWEKIGVPVSEEEKILIGKAVANGG